MATTGSDAPVDRRVVRTREDVLGAVMTVLIDEGWDAVTHQRVAQVAGYSKATVYKHWPTRTSMILAAFTRLRDVPHHSPTGDLRADLIAELIAFRTAIEDERFDRALGILFELTHTVPELVEVRRRLITDGERIIRLLLRPHFKGVQLEAATLMLAGAVLHSVMLHGKLPTDRVIAAAVDLVLTNVSAE